MTRGIGWTPTNVQITCFDVIAETPYGALGDLLLVPSPEAGFEIDYHDGSPAERLMLGDILDLDGQPWECCTRSLLRGALARLRRVGGVDLLAAFEHEFQLLRDRANPGAAYTFSGFSDCRVLGETLMAVLSKAGLRPDTFMKEYGLDQYEITIGPELGARAADAAVFVRELTRLSAKRLNERVSFAPILDPASVGNGVHIHMSLVDANGIARTYEANGPGGLSPLAGAFAAGIVKYLDAIVALTAPSAVSYLRLTPHRWSAVFNNVGFRDREAALRICPVTALDPLGIASQYNLEFRAADAAASPHLALAAIVHAGAQGIEEGLSAPPISEEDLSELDADTLAERGYRRLPQSLDEALSRFGANDTVRGWFGERFCSVYQAHKRAELAYLAEMNDPQRCAAYAAVY